MENDKKRQIHQNADARTSARRAREDEEQRTKARPFRYPNERRQAETRASRRITREQADSDMTPGIPGGQGTTGGGQPGGTGVGVPPDSEREMTPEEYADTVGWTEPTREDESRE